jgi:hypothetical protein
MKSFWWLGLKGTASGPFNAKVTHEQRGRWVVQYFSAKGQTDEYKTELWNVYRHRPTQAEVIRYSDSYILDGSR